LSSCCALAAGFDLRLSLCRRQGWGKLCCVPFIGAQAANGCCGLVGRLHRCE